MPLSQEITWYKVTVQCSVQCLFNACSVLPDFYDFTKLNAILQLAEYFTLLNTQLFKTKTAAQVTTHMFKVLEMSVHCLRCRQFNVERVDTSA